MHTRMLTLVALVLSCCLPAAAAESFDLKNASLADCVKNLGAINGFTIDVRDDRQGAPPAVLKDFAASKGAFWQDWSRLEKAFGASLEWVGEAFPDRGVMVRIAAKSAYLPKVLVSGRYRVVGLYAKAAEGQKERMVIVRLEFTPGDRVIGARWLFDDEKSKWQTSDFQGCVDVMEMVESRFADLKGGFEVLIGKKFSQAILDYAEGSSTQVKDSKGVKSVEVVKAAAATLEKPSRESVPAYSVQFKLDWKYVGLFPCEMKEVALQDDQGKAHREATSLGFELDTATGNKLGLFTFTVAKWPGASVPRKLLLRIPTEVAEELLEIKDFKKL